MRIHKAVKEDDKEGFPEFLHGKKFTPGGTRSMAWSAAAAILSEQYLKGKRLFGVEDSKT